MIHIVYLPGCWLYSVYKCFFLNLIDCSGYVGMIHSSSVCSPMSIFSSNPHCTRFLCPDLAAFIFPTLLSLFFFIPFYNLMVTPYNCLIFVCWQLSYTLTSPQTVLLPVIYPQTISCNYQLATLDTSRRRLRIPVSNAHTHLSSQG